MLVVVAGMYRSGSTFSFNIVRELLEARGGATSISSNSLDVATLRKLANTHVVLKSHLPDPQCVDLIKAGTALCICTFRKPEDAITSWSSAFGFDLDSSLEIGRQWLTWHRSIANYAMNISYDQLDRAPLSVIMQIQRKLFQVRNVREALILRWKYDKKRVKKAYDKLDESEGTTNIGFTYFDSRTFFHRRHVTSLAAPVAAQMLDQASISRIRDELRDFVDAAGNYVP